MKKMAIELPITAAGALVGYAIGGPVGAMVGSISAPTLNLVQAIISDHNQRLKSRLSRIAQNVSICLNCSCATWINLGFVGYSRHETNGSDFFSDSENVFVYWWQRLRGIATRDHSIAKQQGE